MELRSQGRLPLQKLGRQTGRYRVLTYRDQKLLKPVVGKNSLTAID